MRLSDFGLAGDLNVEADAMTVGACGTTGYMAQELLANMRYDTTPDLFAFGVLIFEMLVRACVAAAAAQTRPGPGAPYPHHRNAPSGCMRLLRDLILTAAAVLLRLILLPRSPFLCSTDACPSRKWTTRRDWLSIRS